MNAETEWFYATWGTRSGPVSTEKLKELHRDGLIQDDTAVWHSGLKDWLPFRESEVSENIERKLPPPLAASFVSNVLVWCLAFSPLLIGIIDATVVQFKRQALAQRGWWNLIELKEQGGLITINDRRPVGLWWFVGPTFYAVLALLDERKLKAAGRSSGSMPLWAILLPPAYLFIRASRLGQFPSYAIVFLICALIAILG
ncbi:MAG: DUF4339 domain-containing protein [Xanthobacteraceae bacterium]|nr:DUF4339 domain-containing protein [Xanthobacteraceae bacterium]